MNGFKQFNKLEKNSFQRSILILSQKGMNK